jgi:cyclophilin family peptidyl-prolyl cis-trans isomerase
MTRSSNPIATVLLLLATACADSRPPGSDVEALRANEALWARMLEAEDTRGAGGAGTTPLVEGLRHAEPVMRRIAVRAIGRLERDSLGPLIMPLLADPSPAVRAEAANALGQVSGPALAGAARSALRERITAESEPAILGVLAESLGRLPHDDSAGVALTVTTLAGLADRAAPLSPSTDSLKLGVARGLYFLARQPAGRGAVGEPGLAALRRLATDTVSGEASPSVNAQRIRTAAAATLVATGRATASDLRLILGDPDPFVRREAVAGLATIDEGDTAANLVRSALDDPSPVVRYEALRVDARVNAVPPCAAALRAVSDSDTHVALLAIDRLATGCGGDAANLLLDSIAATLPAPDAPLTADWHRPAQAAAALAGVDPARARPHIAALEQSRNPFVRMRAARAAMLTLSGATLHRLASDADANVRTEAVRGLSRVEGHVADAVYIAQLNESDDSQLLQAAAAALAGTPDPRAAVALLDALDRLTERGRDTERDARIAIIDRLSELGDATHATRLARRADDYDPRVAERASETVERWTGERPAPSPRPAPADSLPTLEQIEELDRARVTIEMEDRTRITVRLFAFIAPTNAWRFARLARAGYYDGLTFHRVAPNFVIQGGSPNANEYAGDGPFSRDEVGLVGNWRGTIGLSTRGRDTGDAQLYINLADNVRLDHEYTVFGEVTSDLDAIHGILEGAVIRRISID